MRTVVLRLRRTGPIPYWYGVGVRKLGQGLLGDLCKSSNRNPLPLNGGGKGGGEHTP